MLSIRNVRDIIQDTVSKKHKGVATFLMMRQRVDDI